MSKSQKISLIKIIVGASMMIGAHFIPVDGYWQLLIYLVPYFLLGGTTILNALKNIFRGHLFDEDFLMSLATVGALVLGEYTEAVAVMLFSQIGNLFEDIAVGKSRDSITELMDICPDTATLLRDGKEEVVDPYDVAVGDIIVVKPGEKIPLDGVVVEGSTSVNTSALTGEALPVEKNVGDDVISGSINLNGLIRVKVKSEFAESTVSKILEMVENASEKKAVSESFITRFAAYYTPVVVICAALVAFIPPLFFSQAWAVWIKRAMVFLVVSCPCALVISVPLSFFGGIGNASKKGILIKGSVYLEQMAKTDIVVFDKTGTLTEGSFSVVAVHPDKVSEDELLDLAAAAESYSTHPIAESIILAHGGHVDHDRISHVEELSGMGVKAIIDGKTVHVGNAKLMNTLSIDSPVCEIKGTCIHVAHDGIYMGHIVISDRIKKNSKPAISALKNLGVKKSVMLTGDAADIAEHVGGQLSIDEVHSELLPNQKVEIVEKLLNEKDTKHSLAFVGDGINDAPVLTRSDLGIAMGALGSDAAIEAADIVLMDDDPSKIASAIRLSRFTMKIVWENIIFSLGVKIGVMLLAALGIAANMWLAIFADVGVLIIAVMNAMRCIASKSN